MYVHPASVSLQNELKKFIKVAAAERLHKEIRRLREVLHMYRVLSEAYHRRWPSFGKGHAVAEIICYSHVSDNKRTSAATEAFL